MIELLRMIEHKAPDVRHSQVWRKNAWKWYRQYNELSRLERRRPELYEKAVMALVNYIAESVEREKNAYDGKRLDSRGDA